MQTPETLKRSIATAEDLAGVVRTMKTMAAVSIRQYERATESLDVYARTIEAGLRMVLRDSNGANVSSHSSTSNRTGGIVFGSDQGMCGQFNEQIGTFAADSLLETSGVATDMSPVLCIGHRVADTLSTAGLSVERTFSLPGSAVGITCLVQDLLPVIDDWRNAYGLERLVVFHNRRLSASTWKPFQLPLLPLNMGRLRQPAAPAEGAEDGAESVDRSLPTWTMETGVLFSKLVQQFLFVSLFRACAESLAGENASRIAAMQAAEKNIKDRLQALRSVYAMKRQTAITEELLDVVTGFEALSHAE